ncbi:hypothetical protein [Planomonospora parontospora]|uniref:hypothetical protein n=1 Tax=Planomonospora parontospora TaxID=58119 RepID=UPI0016717845|nr:hypothetical protein [Planomonospora parontospora]GGL40375.1 hypothetical protein GCM10014719_46890 [Planomonospora parontospora subsp. antibiotica]GII16231.1 hypothetical protein Ppa05_29570 [Planomonospora parontospora subsp. antibiotica]
MGTRPCERRAVRLAAGALFAVQTTFIAAAGVTAAPARGPVPAPVSAAASGVPMRLAAPASRPRRVRPVWLGHSQAARRAQRAGLGLYSSGGCTDRWIRQCTSLEAIRTRTLRGAIRLKRRSGCPVTLTGGTEIGHVVGRYSHGNGYKLDVAPNACVDRHITRTQPFRGVRSDGALLYGSPESLYARTPSHWDILFR